MNTKNIFGFVMLVLLAMVPFGSAAVQPTLEQKINTALTHAQAVEELQTKIAQQLPLAGGLGQVDANLYNTYRLGLLVYENDINSIPDSVSSQTTVMVQNTINLQTAANNIENTNWAISLRLIPQQGKPLQLEDSKLVAARKYIDGLIMLEKWNLNKEIQVASEIQVTITQNQQTLVTQASTSLTQAEYDAQNAAFEAQKTDLINQMSDLQITYSNLMSQATALQDPVSQATINTQNIAVKILKEQTTALHLTVENVPPPIQVDTDGDGVADVTDNCPNNANANQADANNNGIGDVCEENVTPNDYQAQYNALKEQYNNYDNDYNSYERRYTRAQENGDTSQEKSYKKKLQNLQDDVDTLNNDLDHLLSDVEDNGNNASLENKINNLIDDVQQLNDNIDETLGKGTHRQVTIHDNQDYIAPTQPRATAPVDQPTVQPVEVQRFAGLPTIDQTTTQATGWESMRVYAWLGVGALLIVAVLILLIAAIVRK